MSLTERQRHVLMHASAGRLCFSASARGGGWLFEIGRPLFEPCTPVGRQLLAKGLIELDRGGLDLASSGRAYPSTAGWDVLDG